MTTAPCPHCGSTDHWEYYPEACPNYWLDDPDDAEFEDDAFDDEWEVEEMF